MRSSNVDTILLPPVYSLNVLESSMEKQVFLPQEGDNNRQGSFFFLPYS